MALATGTTLGSYEILSPLGAGGMGEVYLARDTRLGRRVALKLLHHDDGSGENVRRRFEQEARTASSLNHRNIVSIFDIGQQDGFDYIAMEYVEGETLRTQLSRGRIDVRRAVDLAAQAAAGLAAAHDANVIHRDIKPENLMIAQDGHLKILDFGLAKLTDKPQSLLAANAATVSVTPALTRVGTIVGTTAYMSPEQAQGQDLDGRTDIFSLGLVLYECLTGQPAFAGRSVIDILHAIINAEPRSAVEVNPRLPNEVMDVLGKALAKDLSERYRHAGDFELDLRRFKRALESGSLSALRASRSASGSGSAALKWIAAAAAGIAIGAVGAWQMRRPASSPAPTNSFAAVTLAPLTTDPGFEGDPSFSPDGETLAYVSDRTGNFEIFLKQVSGGNDVNITDDAADDVQPAFSPDGRQIAFVSTRAGASDLLFMGPNTPMRGGDIWVMPALGGNGRRVARSGNFPGWSPDGADLVFTAGPWFGPKMYRVNASGGEPREIRLQFSPGVSPAHLLYPRFSPDGNWIVFSSPDDVFVVSADGGEVKAIARGQGPAWSGDSKSIVYSNGEVGTNQSLWSVAFDPGTGQAAGPARPITIGRGADMQAALSRDGSRIAFASVEISTRIESQAFDAETGRSTGSPVSLTTSRDKIDFFDLARDGRLALFELRRGQASSIWRGGGNQPLVRLAADAHYDQTNPRWSPDGNTIAFSRRPTQDLRSGFSLWIMAADGANPQRVVEKMGLNGLFTWMPDGRGIVHVGADRQLYLLDLASKTERKLTNEPGVMPIVTISADSRWIIYQCVAGATIDLHAVPAEGGTARVVVASPAEDYHPSVSATGRWVYYLPDHKNLYRVPGPAQNWRAAQPEKVTNFSLTPISFIENPQLSRDGKQLAYSRGQITSDIWLMTSAASERPGR
jgi:serine/threonine protein kinase/Tol biopolymer transport system component